MGYSTAAIIVAAHLLAEVVIAGGFAAIMTIVAAGSCSAG